MSNSILVFLVWSGVCSVLALAYHKLLDATVLAEVSLHDELEQDEAEELAGILPNWGVALLAGTMNVSLVQCLNTFLRDCEFEFIG